MTKEQKFKKARGPGKGQIKFTTGIFPPAPTKIEHEVTLELQRVMEAFEKQHLWVPALSRFDPVAGPITNFKRVVLKQ